VVSGEPYPEAVLATIHDIESDYGRVREKRWASRGLDIDLLAAGDAILPDQETLLHWMELPLERQSQEAPAELLLPHPRLHERAFVLVPMADVAPNWRHPVLNRTVREMLSDLPDAERRAIVPLDDQSWP
jgi:2-amino-4-hydroxy-6-hydroxymethyldihydropteridine diphosphokinase